MSNSLKTLKAALEDIFKMVDVIEGDHLDDVDVKTRGVGGKSSGPRSNDSKLFGG